MIELTEAEQFHLPGRPPGSYRLYAQRRPGSHQQDGHWRRPAQWAGRGLHLELGNRAYRYLQIENREHQWPPGLIDWEELCDA